jgi:hypothetical protein
MAMKVTFTKVHQKGYSVSVEGPNIDASTMNPAPGYDPRLPHDAAHFIVENELGILGGVFGQLAAGGTANTFFSTESKHKRKARERGSELSRSNKDDALFSEHAVYAAQSRWEKHDIIPETKIASDDIQRIIEKFEAFAKEWSEIQIGDSMTFEWNHKPRRAKPR